MSWDRSMICMRTPWRLERGRCCGNGSMGWSGSCPGILGPRHVVGATSADGLLSMRSNLLDPAAARRPGDGLERPHVGADVDGGDRVLLLPLHRGGEALEVVAD